MHMKNKLKEKFNSIISNRTIMVCAILSVIYIISGFWKWFEIGVSVCALVFLVILPLADSLCVFMFLHSFTLSNIVYDSCFMVTLIGYCLILLVKYIIGVRKNHYEFNKKITYIMIGFIALSLLVNIGVPIYRGAWLYLTYLPLAYLLFNMRKDLSIKSGMNYMFAGIIATSLMALVFMNVPHFGYEVFTPSNRFSAFTNCTNYLYMRAMVVLCYYMYAYLNNKLTLPKFAIIYGVCALVTLSTLSKTGMGVLILFTLIFIVLWLKKDFKKNFKYVLIFLFIIVLIALIFHDFIFKIITRYLSAFKAEDFIGSLLTGRDEIWKVYLNKCVSNPFRLLFGHGLLGEELFVPALRDTWATHNLYIFMLYRFGILGSLAFIYVVIAFAKYFFKSKPKFIAYLPLIFMLIESMFDNTFKSYNFTYFVFAVMVLLADAESKEKHDIIESATSETNQQGTKTE